MEHIRITLPQEYPWVIFVTGIVSFQCLLIGFGAGGKRGKIFSQNEKIKEKYENAHYAAF